MKKKYKPTEKRLGADISDRSERLRNRAEERHASKFRDIINKVLFRPLTRRHL